MCTVTVIPVEGMVRLACNRDESRLRPAALLPRTRRFGDRRAVLPIDPPSGGTWVAANDTGLAMTLLNVTSVSVRPAAPTHPLSRGTIIPSLLHFDSPSSAACSALDLDAARFAPFRLVIVNRHELVEVRSDGSRMRLVNRTPLSRAYMFTSSGLGDQHVEGVRQQLFDEYFDRPGDWPARQDAFHRHCWPDRPHLSVCMHRQDARTVSHSVVSLGPDRVTLTYHPDAPDRSAEQVSVSLDVTAEVMS